MRRRLQDSAPDRSLTLARPAFGWQAAKRTAPAGMLGILVRSVFGLASVAALLLLLSASTGAPPHKKRLPREDASAAFARLEAWVKKRGGKLGAVVVDLNTAEEWLALQPDEAMNPASNQKLLTAAAALDLLGADYRYRTTLSGHISNGTARELVLRGHGDPSLDVEELWRLAKALKAQGVQSIEGDVLVDQSRFDDKFEPPAYKQQPDEWAAFRAPVSAISVNQNTVTLNVRATEPGKAARVWFDPPGVVKLSGSVATKAPGSGSSVTWKVSAATAGVHSRLAGHVSAGQPRMRFVRRVADPRTLPGHVLVSLFKELKVTVKGGVSLGRRQGGERLAYLTSPPLSLLLHQLGKHSDNFYAETIFKTLGGDATEAPASSEMGAKRVHAWLTALGLGRPQNKIVNGSGLFQGNQLTPRTIVDLLAKMYLDPRLGPDFMAQLAVAAGDGTLRSRFRGTASRGRIRAKTGTLRDVAALGGYVLSSSGRLPIVFAVLVNGIENRHTEVRSQIDRAVNVLAEGS